ncbi:hypothetical protein [Pseudolactococcus laudensis]|uniref:hypothetical protein n=1 Tax=Pseudolactococcus laudensis TaxID=1494461 RepID=UPI002FC96300
MRLRAAVLFILSSLILLFGGEVASARTAQVIIQQGTETLTQLDRFQVLAHQEPGTSLQLDDLKLINQSDRTDFKLFLSVIKDAFHHQYLTGYVIIKNHEEERQVSLVELVKGLTLQIPSGDQLTLSPHFALLGAEMPNETQEMSGQHAYQLSLEKFQKPTESEEIKRQDQGGTPGSVSLPLTGDKVLPVARLIGGLLVVVAVLPSVKKGLKVMLSNRKDKRYYGD